MLFAVPFRTASLRALVAVVVILGSALTSGTPAMAATTWTVLAGSETHNHGIQGNAFLPGDLSIQVGDTITWNANSGEAHTVTFEYGPPPAGLSGFAVITTPAGGDTFGGSGWFNSGPLTNNPGPGESSHYTLKFTAPGNYIFHCLVHSTMQATLHVLPTTQPLPHTQSFYTHQGIRQQNRLLAEGREVREAGLSTALRSPVPAITAGDGRILSTSTINVLQFLPKTKFVHVGDTVSWTNLDPEAPHTVTFGADPNPSQGPLGALLPVGTDGVGHATISGPITSTINSGFLAAPGPLGINGTEFKVTFTAAGVYQYRCVLHDDLGMVGTITVLAPGD